MQMYWDAMSGEILSPQATEYRVLLSSERLNIGRF
jgi:hypothetical protein